MAFHFIVNPLRQQGGGTAVEDIQTYSLGPSLSSQAYSDPKRAYACEEEEWESVCPTPEKRLNFLKKHLETK